MLLNLYLYTPIFQSPDNKQKWATILIAFKFGNFDRLENKDKNIITLDYIDIGLYLIHNHSSFIQWRW